MNLAQNVVLMNFIDRLIPFIGVLAGVAFVFGTLGCLVVGNWANAGWLLLGTTLFYVADLLNMIRHQEVVLLRELIEQLNKHSFQEEDQNKGK